MIAAGADVNAVGEMGEVPLHAALRQNDLCIIESRLNANPHIRSEFDETAIEVTQRIGGEVERLFKRYLT